MDVIELRQFYASPLGQRAREVIAAHLRRLPMPPPEARVLGLGFAAPWLDIYRPHVQATFAFMPAHQGAMCWPVGTATEEAPRPATALVDEAALPLPDASINLALVVHALELTPTRARLLAELWRVLAPSGQVIFIVPNRAGLWSRAEATPFGHGRPFSRHQLQQVLQQASFVPTEIANLLFMPPWRLRLLRAAPGTWEHMGGRLFPGLSGLLLARAEKRVLAVRRQRRPALLVPGLQPVGAGLVPVRRAGT